MKFSNISLSHLDTNEVAMFAEAVIVLGTFEDLTVYVGVSASRCQVCLTVVPSLWV